MTRLKKQIIGNDNSVVVDAEKTKQVVNGETIYAGVQHETIELMNNPTTGIVNTETIDLLKTANDNTSNDPNTPEGLALVPKMDNEVFGSGTQVSISAVDIQKSILKTEIKGIFALRTNNMNTQTSSGLPNFEKVTIDNEEYTQAQINNAIQVYGLQSVIDAVPPFQYTKGKKNNIKGSISQLLQELKLMPVLKKIRKRPGAHPGKGLPSKGALIEFLYGLNPYETKKIESLSKRWVRRAIKRAMKNNCGATSLLVAKLKEENKQYHEEAKQAKAKATKNQTFATKVTSTPQVVVGQLFEGAIVDLTQIPSGTNPATTSLPLANDALVLVAVMPDQLPYAMDLIQAWGLSYADNIVWDRDRIKGQGVWARNQHINILIATKGNPNAPMKPFRLESVHFDHQGQGQTNLPDYYFATMGNLIPGGSFLEVFSKRCYDNQWTSY